MSAMTVMPRGPGEWTIHDLAPLPDDGLQYELLDGILLVSPSPTLTHQRAVRQLFKALDARCPAALEIFFAPLDWRPDQRTSLQPDLLVVRRDDASTTSLVAVPLLVVEVLSASTRRKDRILKAAAYADGGVASYWLVDPEQPSIDALALVDGGYVPLGEAIGDQVLTLDQPFPVTVRPADLLSR